MAERLFTNSEVAKRAAEETRQLSDEELKQRVIERAFGGDDDRYRTFVSALEEVIPPGNGVVLRGSAVTGVRWVDGQPFDADGPGTSDLDLTFVGGDMLKLWDDDAFYIPMLHTMPLTDDTPQVAPVFVPLRRALCKISGRAVNIQATASLVQYARDVLFGQPYLTLVEKRDREKSDEEERNVAEGERGT